MKVEFELTAEQEAMLNELAQRQGVVPESLLYVLAFFGFRRELEGALERARRKDDAAEKNAPAPIDWSVPQPPAPIKWPKAVRR